MTTKTLLLVLLLASLAVCSSSHPTYCRCVRTIKAVNWSHVTEVIDLEPRPFCRRREIIVVMKNGKSRCVDLSVTVPPHLHRAN